MSYLCYFYKIYNSEDNKVYIGSTRTKLRKRWSCHKSDCKANKQADVYKHMRKIGIEKFDIVEIKRKEVQDKQEQFKIERRIQDETDNKINTNRSYRSYEESLEVQREWNKNNKEKKAETDRLYRLNNGDKIKQYEQKNIDTARYRCEVCDHNFSKSYKINRHFNSRRHKKIVEVIKNIKNEISDSDSD